MSSIVEPSLNHHFVMFSGQGICRPKRTQYIPKHCWLPDQTIAPQHGGVSIPPFVRPLQIGKGRRMTLVTPRKWSIAHLLWASLVPVTWRKNTSRYLVRWSDTAGQRRLRGRSQHLTLGQCWTSVWNIGEAFHQHLRTTYHIPTGHG